jgi:hypothetical protein
MSVFLRLLALAVGLVALTPADAAALEYTCRKQDSSLRLALEVRRPGHTLPCEVVVENDRGERALLYSAQYDRNYCPSRIEKTRAEVEAEGWICEQTAAEPIAQTSNLSAGSEAGEAEAAALERADAGTGEVAAPAPDRSIVASQRCSKDGEARQVMIEVEDPAHGTPCDLLYWPDGDLSKPGELLWRAEHDATFCPSRLDSIIEKWTSEGWQCGGDEARRAALEPEGESSSERVPEAIDAAPEALAEDDAADLPRQAAEAAGVPPAAPATGADAAGADAAGEDAAAQQNRAGEVGPSGDAALEAVVSADAERISEWMEVEPAIEIAARGDLNDDGTNDAVVVLAYQSDQTAYRQYLMSYLVADGGYELASVKLLAGIDPPAQARVDQIDDGVIWVTMGHGDGSSPAQIGFRLQDQQLIEIDAERVEGGN